MPEPILFVVDNDLATLESLAAVLERRFGADYRILTDVSPASALARIEEACERGEKVALVVADLWTAVVRVVGERWSSRCQELLDLAARNSVACEFLAHDSDEGRRVLDELGHAGQLPAVIFRDQALGDPTNAEIAEMLGGHIEPDGGLYDLVIARGGPGRSRCRRLRRLGRVAHARDRVQGTGRAGGDELDDPELSRVPPRDQRGGPGVARARPGDRARRRVLDHARGHRSRAQRRRMDGRPRERRSDPGQGGPPPPASPTTVWRSTG